MVKSSSKSSKSSAETGEELVELATLGRAHGLRGALNLIIDASMAQAVWPGLRVYLQQRDSLDSREVATVSTPGKHIVVSFVGIDNRNNADPLTGAKVMVRRADLPALENDEYYDFELLGATVESRAGQQLGTVVEIVPTGANQVYVVRSEDGQEILVPAFFGAVLEVNRAEKRIVVDPTALEYSKRDD